MELSRRSLFGFLGVVGATPFITKAAEAANFFPEAVKELAKDIDLPAARSELGFGDRAYETYAYGGKLNLTVTVIKTDIEDDGCLDAAVRLNWSKLDEIKYYTVKEHHRHGAEISHRLTSGTQLNLNTRKYTSSFSVQAIDFRGNIVAHSGMISITL